MRILASATSSRVLPSQGASFGPSIEGGRRKEDAPAGKEDDEMSLCGNDDPIDLQDADGSLQSEEDLEFRIQGDQQSEEILAMLADPFGSDFF